MTVIAKLGLPGKVEEIGDEEAAVNIMVKSLYNIHVC